MADQERDLEKIISRLESLESRLSKLESVLKISGEEVRITDNTRDLTPESPAESLSANEDSKGLESQIGRFGLAWMGNIVLLFGITFLTQYLMILELRIIAVVFGYVAASGIFLLARYLKNTNESLSFMFKMNALIILFYTSLKLHFFSPSPLLTNKPLAIIILFLIVAFQTMLTIKNKSQAYGTLSVIFALATAVLSDTIHIMLPLVAVTAAGTIYYYYRFSWKPLIYITIVLTYTTFFLWLFGNPFAGHPMELISEQHGGITCLFILGALYSLLLLLRKSDESSDDFLIGITFTNGLLFTFLLALSVLRFYYSHYVSLFAIITFCCLIYSTILHSRSEWNFASAFYALYGFMAMTIAIYGLYGFPRVYWLLSVQSLIVVSMALWFRNRLIVVMNSLLFLTILLIYLFSAKPIAPVNFSFAIVALVSARVINWKRSRLKIKTDLIRNLYMILGFFMVMFALYHSVPKHFVSLSWTLAALFYFLLSLLLKNVKYRYMALGTIICAAFYLFIVDLARIELIFRVLALLVLASISIGISIYYTSRIKKSDS